MEEAHWRSLCARSFPSATLPGASEAAPPLKTCVPPPASPPSPAPASASAVSWKRLYQFHRTLLYRCLVRGGPPRARPAVIRLAPGALFVALPLAVS